jgi:GNAT superfamily N-acetyltransferase
MSEVTVEFAGEGDLSWLCEHDREPGRDVLRGKIARGEILVARGGGDTVGWLRFSFFWDVIPFMSMLFILEPHRGRGIGTRLVGFFEREMKRRGFTRVMTSSQSDERGQHLYRKLGYRDAGALLLPGEPLEVFFLKSL